MIPFLDLSVQTAEIRDELDHAYSRVMSSGAFILGRELEQFEEEFAAYCGTRYCIGVGNGLDAIEICLRAYGIGPGDEVIVPGFTFIATWLAVRRVGAEVVPVDIDENTYNIDPLKIEAAVTTKTKALIAVHLFGQIAEVELIKQICQKHAITLIEDAAQAHGAKFKGQAAGSFGSAGAFSFYPGKNLGAFGDGGAVTTNDTEAYEKIRRLRNYGSAVKYNHEISGYNSRLDEMQAAFLRVKLKYLDSWNLNRLKIANIYLSILAPELIKLPKVKLGGSPVWHLFVVRVKNRNLVQKRLLEKGVQTSIHYPLAPGKTPVFNQYAKLQLPISDSAADSVLSLPMGSHLSAADAQKIAAILNATVAENE